MSSMGVVSNLQKKTNVLAGACVDQAGRTWMQSYSHACEGDLVDRGLLSLEGKGAWRLEGGANGRGREQGCGKRALYAR